MLGNMKKAICWIWYLIGLFALLYISQPLLYPDPQAGVLINTAVIVAINAFPQALVQTIVPAI